MTTNLSVNINKVATLRNARGENNPDVCKVAVDCQEFGADGITVHPRPDERHIRRADVYALRPIVRKEFNIEGYPDEEFMKLVLAVKPEQATLVPDAPGVLTSSAGWDVTGNFDFLQGIAERMRDAGIRTSIFVAPDAVQIAAAARAGADRVELYTKPYADGYAADPAAAVNLAYFADRVPYLDEVSIGHALICDALYLGLSETISRYRKCLAR